MGNLKNIPENIVLGKRQKQGVSIREGKYGPTTVVEE
jgi:hypothetical protein